MKFFQLTLILYIATMLTGCTATDDISNSSPYPVQSPVLEDTDSKITYDEVTSEHVDETTQNIKNNTIVGNILCDIYNVGVLDIEKSQLPGIADRPWQTDTCIGNWFYDAKAPFKQPEQIIEMLVDIISKNACKQLMF